MIAQGDFVLMDPEKLILPIGNLGARGHFILFESGGATSF